MASLERYVSEKKPPSLGCGFSFSNVMISSAVIPRSFTRVNPLSQADLDAAAQKKPLHSTAKEYTTRQLK
jgi:hypothetical protein